MIPFFMLIVGLIISAGMLLLLFGLQNLDNSMMLLKMTNGMFFDSVEVI